MEQFIGCDAHKKFSVFVAVNEKGRAGEAVRVVHDRQVYREFLGRLPPGSEIAVEASGSYSWLVDEMERSGHCPKLCNPLEAKRRMALTKKTDKLDARGLAILLRNGTLPEVWIPPSELRDQRELLRLRIFLVRLKTRVKNRIHSTLARHNIQVPGADLFGVAARFELGIRLPELPTHMGVQAPSELMGIHTNMANVIPLDIDKLAFSGAPAPANLSADEKLAYERLSLVYAKGIGYGFQMGLRPQTLYGIADSPVGLAAYFLDHDARSYDMIARVFAGGSEGLTRDDVLDNITLTWLTNTALSGARLYWENKGGVVLRRQGCRGSDCRERLPRRTVSCSKDLGGTGISQTRPLQQTPEGRPLRGMGTAQALFRRGSRWL
jgi:hypothetical protein